MALTKTETATEIVYSDTDHTVTIKKDETCLDVHQVTCTTQTGGQTWQDLRDFLDTKVAQ